MSTGTLKLTRADDGRRMSWSDYVHAEGDEGLQYELSRGVFTVIEVPQWRHERRINELRSQFHAYWTRFPQRLQLIASGAGCRLPVEPLGSDRHPDLAIYKSPPPEDVPSDEFWANWVPEIVVEVVSSSSVVRDYEEKPEEYFRFGVMEYWIIDPAKREMLVYRRQGADWKTRVVREGESYKTPQLRNFELDLAAVFAAGDDTAESVPLIDANEDVRPSAAGLRVEWERASRPPAR